MTRNDWAGHVQYSEAYHREYGAHSNIPACCIDAWMGGRLPGDVPECWRWHYVPCPDCEARLYVADLHLCHAGLPECRAMRQRWGMGKLRSRAMAQKLHKVYKKGILLHTMTGQTGGTTGALVARSLHGKKR